MRPRPRLKPPSEKFAVRYGMVRLRGFELYYDNLSRIQPDPRSATHEYRNISFLLLLRYDRSRDHQAHKGGVKKPTVITGPL